MSVIDLNLASNLLGDQLSGSVRARLMAAIKSPGETTWQDAHGIILSMSPMMTLWQAVLVIDPSFPIRGPACGVNGVRISGWARTPDRETLIQAINYATH